MKTNSYDRSQALFERATKVIPCGIYGHFSPAPLASPMSYPFYAQSAQGAHFTDIDGNDFIDYMCAYGPMVLGYHHPVGDEAFQAQMKIAEDWFQKSVATKKRKAEQKAKTTGGGRTTEEPK